MTCAKGAGQPSRRRGNLGSAVHLQGAAPALAELVPGSQRAHDAVHVPAGREQPLRHLQPGHSAVLLGVADSTSSVRATSGSSTRACGSTVSRSSGRIPTPASARDFCTNAFNIDNCINNVTGAPTPSRQASGSRLVPTQPCPTGYSNGELHERPANVTFNIWQPRVSGTYTVNPGNVVRFSYGRYTQAPNSAFEQYNTLQNDLADYRRPRTSTRSAAPRRATRSLPRRRSTTTSRGSTTSMERNCRSS